MPMVFRSPNREGDRKTTEIIILKFRGGKGKVSEGKRNIVLNSCKEEGELRKRYKKRSKRSRSKSPLGSR
jgi:hypothetical protein